LKLRKRSRECQFGAAENVHKPISSPPTKSICSGCMRQPDRHASLAIIRFDSTRRCSGMLCFKIFIRLISRAITAIAVRTLWA
jgi:hypothetical protein